MVKKSNLTLSNSISDDKEPRLKFLSEFMRLMGDSGAEVARILGITRGGVAHWFSSDDCKLSYCESYMNARGYDLVLSFVAKKITSESEQVSISIERRTPDPEDVHCRRLAFLQVAMAKQDIAKLDIAKALDIKYNTVRHWFIVDDIYVSHIFNIAGAFGFKLSIEIKPKDEQ